MTTEEIYWPEDLVAEVPDTPLEIMQKQAAALGRRTSNNVIAEVDTHTHKGTFSHEFVIKAPALNYRYALFTLQHDIELYPVFETDSGEEFENATELKRFLKSKLTEERTVRVIRGLLSQARHAEPQDDIPF